MPPIIPIAFDIAHYLCDAFSLLLYEIHVVYLNDVHMAGVLRLDPILATLKTVPILMQRVIPCSLCTACVVDHNIKQIVECRQSYWSLYIT